MGRKSFDALDFLKTRAIIKIALPENAGQFVVFESVPFLKDVLSFFLGGSS